MNLDNENIKNNILAPKALRFEIDPFERLILHDTAAGISYEGVSLKRMFPLSNRSVFIAVYHDGREVGIIRDSRELDPQQKSLVDYILNKTYFVPEIQKVNSLREEYRMVHWDVITDRGPLKFYTRTRNDVVKHGNRVFIRDIDSNRYIIPDYTLLDSKSQKEISTEL